MKKPDIYIPEDMSARVNNLEGYVASHPESRVARAYEASRHHDEVVIFQADRTNRIQALNEVAAVADKVVPQTLQRNQESPEDATLRIRRATKTMQIAMAKKGI